MVRQLSFGVQVHSSQTLPIAEMAGVSSHSVLVSAVVFLLPTASDPYRLQFCKIWTTAQSYLTLASFMSIHGP